MKTLRKIIQWLKDCRKYNKAAAIAAGALDYSGQGRDSYGH